MEIPVGRTIIVRTSYMLAAITKNMKRILPKKKLQICPRGCTQHRTKSGRLAEKKTFDGVKCDNCGFVLKRGISEVHFEKAGDIRTRRSLPRQKDI